MNEETDGSDKVPEFFLEKEKKSEVCVYCKEKSVTNALFARGY